jgi:TRAP-type C4-dicarboxylate transport system permease small subunit
MDVRSRPLPVAPVRFVLALSAGLLGIERAAVRGLMALLAILILINVFTRYAGVPIYWIDESAIYSVVWLTFVGASAMTRMRLDFAVTLLSDALPERHRRALKAAAGASVVALGIALIVCCWLWFDPAGFAAAGFDAREFAAGSFNFIYTERTQTLDWPSWALYLTIPIFAVSMTIHATANLLEDLGLAPVAASSGFAASSAERVN